MKSSRFSYKGVDLTNRMWLSVVCTLIDNHMRHHRGQNIVDSGLLSGTGPKNITMESPSILNFQQELQLLNSVNSKLIKTCRCATKEAVPKANENHLSIRNKEHVQSSRKIFCKVILQRIS